MPPKNLTWVLYFSVEQTTKTMNDQLVNVSPFTRGDDIESRVIEFIKNSTPETIMNEFRNLVQKGLNCDATHG